MLRSYFYQQSLLEVDPDEIRLGQASFERGLRDLLPKLVSVDDFAALHPSAAGAPTCDPMVLAGMLLLQFRFDLSDEALVERCRRDLGFRYALRLEVGVAPPGVASLKRFRAAVRELKGADWLLRRSVRLAVEAGLTSPDELQGIDSTNTNQRGATLDTYNLVASAVGQVVRRMAAALGRDPHDLAKEWDAVRYLARSVKGGATINWSDEVERNRFVTAEISDAERVARLAEQAGIALPDEVSEAIALMRHVAYQDVEKLPDGTFAIAKGTAPGRVVSTTDPEARHGRKSASKAITGFKTHVLGTLDSQLVTGIDVTGANVHDAVPAPGLLGQAATVGIKPKDAVGDSAYGTGASRRACDALGVTLHAKLPTPSHRGFTKRNFVIDLAAMSVTCPNDVTTKTYSEVKDPGGSEDRVARFRFSPSDCRECPLREQCSSVTAKGGGRDVVLNRFENEIQEAQRMNARPAEKAILRKRSAIERLIAHLVRMGMRQARFFGLRMVRYQAFMTAAAYNLQRYITLSAAAA